MQKPCSLELRERVVGAVESGASRREAADWFEVGKPQFGNQMDAASAGDGKLCSQAERGHHLPAGGARGLFVCADCSASGPDA
jgi:transposase